MLEGGAAEELPGEGGEVGPGGEEVLQGGEEVPVVGGGRGAGQRGECLGIGGDEKEFGSNSVGLW